MSFSESAFNLRGSFILGVSLLVGCESTNPDTPDAQTLDPALSACAAISDDLSPAATEGSFDGTYGYSEGFSAQVKPACIVADDGQTVHAVYITLDRERFTKYRRVYPSGQGCGTTFDSGGKIEVVSEGVMRGCGPSYTTTDGAFRQAVYLVRLANGSLFRSYTFYGEGPAHPSWQELIVSTRSSDNPFEDAPADLSFGSFRRP